MGFVVVVVVVWVYVVSAVHSVTFSAGPDLLATWAVNRVLSLPTHCRTQRGATGCPAGWAVDWEAMKALQGNETALQVPPGPFKLRAPQD